VGDEAQPSEAACLEPHFRLWYPGES